MTDPVRIDQAARALGRARALLLSGPHTSLEDYAAKRRPDLIDV
jgi:hypothetical protein